MAVQFFIPSVNMMGEGALDDAYKAIQSYGFKKALIVSDAGLKKAGVIEQVAKGLKKLKIDSVIFDKTKPNPTTKNVEEGLALLKKEKCDCIISLGGGSPHDCAKGIALVAANGGKINDYEGLDQSKKPQFPLISINTTAGTASEMTRFCIITDETRLIKMAIVDKHTTPLLSVNDPSLMLGKPVALTAATGMDALTHAVEAYVSIAANPITDACAVKAIELIHKYLRIAVKEGKNMEAREGMAYAQFLAGMAFNNASLGYVHAMAHQLGGFYDLPHGVCNAVLLPHVQRYNAKVSANRLKDLAASFNIDTRKMSDKEGAEVCIEAICQLSKDVNIPSGLKELGVKEKDFPTLAKNALKDACAATNPRVGAEKDVIAIFKKAF